MYLDEKTTELIGRHVDAIIPMLESLDSFVRSPYGSMIMICDEDTLDDVRKALQKISSAAERDNQESHATKLSKSLRLSQEGMEHGLVLTGLRSAAPLATTSQFELPRNYQHYWKKGVAMIQGKLAKTPNPMLAGLISDWQLFHYGSDPLLSFHLATAFAELSENSPLKPLKPDAEDEEYKVAAAARTQFYAWIRAFRSLKDHICVRLVISDAFAFSHTLQYADTTGEVSANWYRRLWDSKVLRLDKASYGHTGGAPTNFDAIDTSNLSDHFDIFNILVSASPLLKPRPWATLFTEQLFDNHKPGKKSLDQLLYGPSSTVSLLLGLIPLQYWTNAKDESHVDEIFVSLLTQLENSSYPVQFRTRLAWKRDDQFGGYYMKRPKLHMKAKDVAEMLFQLYLEMFQNERVEDPNSPFDEESPHFYPRFHRGSFTALLKLIKGRAKTDWDAMFDRLLSSIERDHTLTIASNQVQDFHLHLFLSNLHTAEWMDGIDGEDDDSDGEDDDWKEDDDDDNEDEDDDDDDDEDDDDDDDDSVATIPNKGPLQGWKHLPPVVAVTLVVSRNAFNGLFPNSNPSLPVPTLIGTLKAGVNTPKQWLSVFDDVHIVFGRVTTTGDMNSGDATVNIQEDELGWSGTSPLVATFLVPTAALLEEPVTGLVGLNLATTSPSSIFFAQMLDGSYTVYETILSNNARVFISQLMPGTSAHKVTSGGVRPFKDEIVKVDSEGPATLIAEMSSDKQGIASLTAHMRISSKEGKKLLQDKVPIELQQSDPFAINVVFGKKRLICPLKYPVPVTSIGSKTRIARTSGYIEVIAPLADPKRSKILADYISPTVVTSHGLPVAVNLSHLNLDNLPIVDLSEKERLKWVATLTSFQFSVQERQLRKKANKSGLAEDVRVNFKETLFTMFMVSSGIQGGQRGMFLINHPERGGIQTMMFVSALRLDGDTASVVLDAAIVPLTLKMLESETLREFIYEINPLECCSLTVNDEELALWKKAIPSLVERCRTWNHLPTCEYAESGATVPLSLGHGEKWLCSCGNGKIPDNFLAVPLWDKVAEYAVRIAISPMYALPFVEPVLSEQMETDTQAGFLNLEICGNCTKVEPLYGPKLKKCKGCLKRKYCSTECQKADWRKHRMECGV
ncbi:hypothetical protein V8C37DRAFT_384600 [Trichoderma ceciliae]